jgi:hypothetical protein
MSVSRVCVLRAAERKWATFLGAVFRTMPQIVAAALGPERVRACIRLAEPRGEMWRGATEVGCARRAAANFSRVQIRWISRREMLSGSDAAPQLVSAPNSPNSVGVRVEIYTAKQRQRGVLWTRLTFSSKTNAKSGSMSKQTPPLCAFIP